MKMTRQYLSATQAADYLGISRVQFYRLIPPEPDAKIGTICGWTHGTLNEWSTHVRLKEAQATYTARPRRSE